MLSKLRELSVNESFKNKTGVKIMSRIRTLLNLSVCFAIFGLLAMPGSAHAATWTGSGTDWWTTSNWDSSDSPWSSADSNQQTAEINLQGQEVNLNTRPSGHSTPGELDRLTLKADDDDNGNLSGMSTLNMYEDVDVNNSFVMSQSSSNSDKSELNIYDSTLNLDTGDESNTTIGTGNTATINIKNGSTLGANSDLNLASNSLFGSGTDANVNIESGGSMNVSGGLGFGPFGGTADLSAAGDLSVTGKGGIDMNGAGSDHVFTVNGSWSAGNGKIRATALHIKEGTLRLNFDSGGVSPIELYDDGTYPNGRLALGVNSKLDLGWLNDRDPIYGQTWTVATWDGPLYEYDGGSWTEITFSGIGDSKNIDDPDIPISYATGVDSSKWEVEFISTGSGKMTVTAVPEPSSFALLLLGTLALFHRRRRRNS